MHKWAYLHAHLLFSPTLNILTKSKAVAGGEPCSREEHGWIAGRDVTAGHGKATVKAGISTELGISFTYL